MKTTKKNITYEIVECNWIQADCQTSFYHIKTIYYRFPLKKQNVLGMAF